MCISINRFFSGVVMCLLALGCSAQTLVLSGPFDLCVTPLKGVVFDQNVGLDADVIHARGKGAKATIYVGRHPDIPPGMNTERDKTRYVPRDLGPLLQFVAQSPRKDGHGVVQLYGYNRTASDQILILVSAHDGKANTALVKAIGGALIRCRGA